MYYNNNMLSGIEFSLDDEGHRRVMRALFGATRWNQFVTNWPIALDALRQLWKMGKVSELKTPFYELVERPANNIL